MGLSQSLQQKQLLKLLPQQIQLMKLLQVPTAFLEDKIKEEIEENPALELSSDSDEADSLGKVSQLKPILTMILTKIAVMDWIIGISMIMQIMMILLIIS